MTATSVCKFCWDWKFFVLAGSTRRELTALLIEPGRIYEQKKTHLDSWREWRKRSVKTLKSGRINKVVHQKNDGKQPVLKKAREIKQKVGSKDENRWGTRASRESLTLALPLKKKTIFRKNCAILWLDFFPEDGKLVVVLRWLYGGVPHFNS